MTNRTKYKTNKTSEALKTTRADEYSDDWDFGTIHFHAIVRQHIKRITVTLIISMVTRLVQFELV